MGFRFDLAACLFFVLLTVVRVFRLLVEWKKADSQTSDCDDAAEKKQRRCVHFIINSFENRWQWKGWFGSPLLKVKLQTSANRKQKAMHSYTKRYSIKLQFTIMHFKSPYEYNFFNDDGHFERTATIVDSVLSLFRNRNNTNHVKMLNRSKKKNGLPNCSIQIHPDATIKAPAPHLYSNYLDKSHRFHCPRSCGLMLSRSLHQRKINLKIIFPVYLHILRHCAILMALSNNYIHHISMADDVLETKFHQRKVNWKKWK